MRCHAARTSAGRSRLPRARRSPLPGGFHVGLVLVVAGVVLQLPDVHAHIAAATAPADPAAAVGHAMPGMDHHAMGHGAMGHGAIGHEMTGAAEMGAAETTGGPMTMAMSWPMLLGMALGPVGVAVAAWALLRRASATRRRGVDRRGLATPAPSTLDDGPLVGAHWVTAAILTVALAVDVMKPFTIGFALPGMIDEYGISTSHALLLPLSSITGSTLGSLAWGAIGDRWGRRTAYLLALLVFVSTSACGAMPAFELNVVTCFAMGASAGGLMPLVFALLTEIVPRRHRRWLTIVIGGVGASAGYLAASGAAYLLEPAYTWRALWLVGLPSGLLLIALQRGVPESPAFLARVGRVAEAAAVIARYRPRGVETTPPAEPRRRSAAAPERLPSPPRAGGALVATLALVGIGWGLANYGLLTLLPLELRRIGVGDDAVRGILAGSALIALPCLLPVAWLYGFKSSRLALVGSAALSVVALLGVALWSGTSRDTALLAVVLVTLIVALAAVNAMLMPYAAEIFSARRRVTGTGLIGAAMKLGGVAGLVWTALALPGLAATAVVVAGITLLGAALLARHAPEITRLARRVEPPTIERPRPRGLHKGGPVSNPYPAEPWRIKAIEPLKTTTRAEREQAIQEAGWNSCLLRAEDVTIDLFTDSGTGAMSDAQWAAMMVGDEAYAGARSFYRLEAAVREHYGYEHVIPAHQGRGAENLLSRALIRPGHHVPGNMYFPSTRAHQELNGATFHDVIVAEAHDATSEHPFKGDVDLGKLEAVIRAVGADAIPYVSIGATVNMAGGQPISVANLAQVRELTRAHGIPVILDAARAVENAWFVKQREAGWQDRSVAEILRAICALTDGATMSSKKDSFANIGGWLAVRDAELADQARNLVVLYEGLHTYGGMAGRDMEAVARGIEESVQEESIGARVAQVEYLGQRLIDAGVPVVRPIGGHAVFLDAAAILERVPRDQFPAQTLTAALYVDAGVRGVERGTISAGRDPVTGENRWPSLELVRLAIPRRVYTRSHIDAVADSVLRVHAERDRIVSGLRFTYEPAHMRFFRARFEPVAPASGDGATATADDALFTDRRIATIGAVR
jgi:tyrosine phenol-lyase